MDSTQSIVLVDGIEVLPMSTSHKEQYYLLHHHERRLKINQAVYDLYQLIKKDLSISIIAKEFSKKRQKEYSCQDIVTIANKYFGSYGLLIDNEEIKANIENKNSKRRHQLLVKKDIISESALQPLTNTFKSLFHKPLFITVFASCLLFLIYFTIKNPPKQTDLNSITITDGLIIYVIFLISILFHELGHLSACRQFGARHGHLGIGLYLYFPVFYADVTDTWKLSRYQRIIVDFGGMYFQVVYTCFLILAYYFLETNIILYAIYFIQFNMLLNLNPFLRFDGYWIASDILGIPNLRKESVGLMRYFLAKIGVKKNVVKPSSLNIRSFEKILFIIYTIVTSLFLLYFFVRIPLYLKEMYESYPVVIHQLVANFNGDILGKFIFQTLMLFIILYLIIRFVKSIVKHINFKREDIIDKV